jgi:hypothetical protein
MAAWNGAETPLRTGDRSQQRTDGESLWVETADWLKEVGSLAILRISFRISSAVRGRPRFLGSALRSSRSQHRKVPDGVAWFCLDSIPWEWLAHA